jgi:DNA-binding CsgD family transcriptional regulator/DNA-binding transcriptional ArsR family regulator
MDPATTPPHEATSPSSGVVGTLPPLPLVGRSSELAMLGGLLDATEKGRGTTLLLEGEGGQGKTRLALATAERATKRGWVVAIGRAYPVEVGVPYALFTDALLPLLRTLDPATLSVLTRGAVSELSHLFPLLTTGEAPIRGATDQGSEVKTRLLWNFAQLLARMAQRHPLLLVLENLQWADESSLEMLHFTARQLGSSRVLVLGTYNESVAERSAALVSLRQSLASLGAARVHHLGPLSRSATDELVHAVFGVSDAVSREFAALLFGWTRGNPFFVEETLKALVTSGRLYERDGMWHGWEIADLDLPRSIREAVVTRLDRLSADAQRVAAMAAVIGTRASYDALDAVVGVARSALVEAIDELRAQRVLEEHREGEHIVYDFSHPILRDVIYQQLGLARARLLHATVADALERHYGARADEHADELAYHFARADARDVGPKATRYLSLAGRAALAKHANREAASYLAAALERTRGGDVDAAAETAIIEGLARARQRLGEYDAAVALWARAREHAQRSNDLARVADIDRRLGLASFWRGRHDEALAYYEAALTTAAAVGAESTMARARLAKGMCLQELGRTGEAEQEMTEAIALAERLGDAPLLARAHRTQLLFYLWTGRTELAYRHAETARELAAASGQRVLEWLAQWALATLGGLTGASEACARHLAEAERLAEELDSPVFRAWTAEIAIELASAKGEWETGLALAERTIALGRSVGLRAPFPRLLVWTAIMHLGRGELERAKAYIDEAWELSGAARGAERPSDVHSVVPAHIGLAAYHLFTRNFAEAIRVGEAGLAIADKAGAAVWAVHRLLPILAESALEARDLRRAEKIGQRLRRDSERLGQRAGLAWADACAALVAMLRGEKERAIVLLRDAAAALEAVPVVADAARVRKQLARVLAESGDREEAKVELRRVHEVFVRLGAEPELALTRQQLRELGTRPPARASLLGSAGLTARELEIVRLVSARKSNKEIGRVLDISPRTVSTHLTNIFTKLGVGSRGELADFVRERNLFAG